MITNCPVCGKAFEVMHPDLWRYKRNSRHICSWSCLRRYDGKEANEVEKITKEQKERAVQIALEGGDPKPFLMECGSKAPVQCWYSIKNHLKTNDPEKYELLAKGVVKKPVEIPERAPAAETPEAQMTHVAPPFEYKVTGIDTAVGTFQYFKSNQFLVWTNLNGETVSMNLEEWRESLKVLPEAMKVLGVEL